MNATPPTVVPILATPFGIVPLPEAEVLNPALLALFTSRMRVDGAREGMNPLCYRSRDDLLAWPEEPVRKLAAEIFRGVYTVINTVNDFSEAQLRSFAPQARAWFTVVEPDGGVSAINYPLAAWCAIYCVAAPKPSATRQDSGILRLYESRLGTTFADATTSSMRLPYTPGHFGLRPVPGQLAVFPASLTHETALVRSPQQLVLVTLCVRFVAPGQQGVGRW
ncbi:MAG: hypothetical protein ABJD53_05510 [Gammaproteobacteria bacterium]